MSPLNWIDKMDMTHAWAARCHNAYRHQEKCPSPPFLQDLGQWSDVNESPGVIVHYYELF